MYERKKPLIELPGFQIDTEDDVTEHGIFFSSTRVENGRTIQTKTFISKDEIHAHLVRALGKKFAPEELKTPDVWCQELGARIVDHDGWRGDPSRNWHDPISRAEFDRRLMRCTIDSTGYPEFRVIPSRRETMKPGVQEL